MSDARKRMRINHEETESAKEDQKKNLALFVSSWLILILFRVSLIAA